MSAVHGSRGRLAPASEQLRSEVAIVCELAGPRARGPRRRAVAAVGGRLRPDPRGDRAARSPASRTSTRGWRTGSPAEPAARRAALHHPVRPRRAHRQPLRAGRGGRGAAAAADPALPRPVQHHDLRPQRPLPRHQGGPASRAAQPRRHRRARAGRGRDRRPRRRRRDGSSARASGSGSCAYDTPRGCAAAYYPETNALVPLDSVADDSGTPTSKSVVIRVEPV